MNAIIDFVLYTNRFDQPLYLLWIHGCFSFYSWLFIIHVATRILISIFSYYFFSFLAPTIDKVPGDCYFCVSCVPVHFHKKKLTSTSYQFVPSNGSLLNTFLSFLSIDSVKYEIQTRHTSGIQSPMVTPIRKCDSIFYLS